MSDTADRFETIAWVYSQCELAIILSVLEQADIYVLPIGRHHAAADWAITTALGGTELRVHAQDAATARALFAGVERTNMRRGVFADNILLDGLIMVVAMFAGLFSPPARMPAEFAAARVEARAEL